MKVQIHQHTSRYSACAVNGPDEMMRALIINGYDAVFITDHDTMWPAAELEELKSQFPELLILPGAELTRECGPGSRPDLLVLGTHDPHYLALPTFADIIDAAKDDACLTVAAHPFRGPGRDGIVTGDLRPDAIEYGCPHHDRADLERAEKVAATTGVRLVNASDVHFAPQSTRFWLETHRAFTNGREFRELILAGEYTNCTGTDAGV